MSTNQDGTQGLSAISGTLVALDFSRSVGNRTVNYQRIAPRLLNSVLFRTTSTWITSARVGFIRL